MSRLQDAWDASSWEVTWFDDLSGVWWKREITDDLCLVVESATGIVYFAGVIIDDENPIVVCDTVEEAQDVAEAMFRQWVYDEYGAVLE